MAELSLPPTVSRRSGEESRVLVGDSGEPDDQNDKQGSDEEHDDEERDDEKAREKED